MSLKNTEYSVQTSLTPTSLKSEKKQELKKHLSVYFLFLDMLHLHKMWRHVKGYPANGQTTYTNSKTSKKNKILLNARLDQFYNLFGKKRRNIFPTLIQAEYNNRLWFYMWPYEWQQGQKFLLELVNPTKQSIPFDPVNLARGQTNGYVRVGAASKIGKAKKITKQGTVGLPIFFTKYIYADLLPESFPYKLSIADDLRKKMGKKNKKKQK